MAKRFTKKSAAGEEVSAPPSIMARRVALAPPLPDWLKDEWMWGLLLILAVILTYAPVWWAGFVWDDGPFITDNPCIVGPLGLKEIWTTKSADLCPLTLTTIWAEHALWGLAPLPYHLVNVLLHTACAVLLWRVLLSLQMPNPGAWLGAALWALHPVQVESVAWVMEIKNMQSGLFFLLSILFFVKYLKAKNSDSEEETSGGWSYGLVLFFGALAMASKSSTVILPVVLCLCAWWMEGRWRWGTLATVIPLFFMSVAAGVLTVWVQKLSGSEDPRWIQTWPQRFATAGKIIWFYVGKLLWPHPLMAIYPQWEIDAGQWTSYLPLLAAIFVFSILWFERRSWSRPYFFAFVYFLAGLFPILGFFSVYAFRYSFVSDHFQYLAAMGPLSLAGAGLALFSNCIIPRRLWLPWAPAVGVLLTLGILSWQRTWIYANDQTLWTDTLSKNPYCWAVYDNLGMALGKSGQIDEAIVYLEKALAMNPNDAFPHNNLGYALSLKGRTDQAIIQLKEALQIDPGDAAAHNNLGQALFQKGQIYAAIVQFQEALEIAPNYIDAHNNLGIAFAEAGRVAEAITQFQEAVRLNPDDQGTQANLAKAEAMLQQRVQQKQ
ncbi:MAG TPA: tetratricopeptide repeat protein [Candidatus Methylacidiphilales bacterium]|nr:tetratricopeptide repeat protein [Candidatus Methylacidiphilales bacterium]